MFLAVPALSQNKENITQKQQKSTKKNLEKMITDIKNQLIKQTDTTKTKKDVKYNIEIDGLIIDESKTKIGREFYDVFFMNWHPPQNIKGFTIYLRERAHPRFGSWVWIDVDEMTVYQTLLKPRFEVIEEAAIDGIRATAQFLVQSKTDQKQLSGQDMSGTGIY